MLSSCSIKGILCLRIMIQVIHLSSRLFPRLQIFNQRLQSLAADGADNKCWLVRFIFEENNEMLGI